MNKKILLSILFGVLIFTGYSLSCDATSLGKYGPNMDIRDLIFDFEDLMWIIFSFIVVICFIVAGVSFLTAQGDAAKLKIAKSAFIWGVVGVVVGILAFSAIAVISNFIRGAQ